MRVGLLWVEERVPREGVRAAGLLTRVEVVARVVAPGRPRLRIRALSRTVLGTGRVLEPGEVAAVPEAEVRGVSPPFPPRARAWR